MKTYYYSISTGKSWSDEKQYSVEFNNWIQFSSFCKKIAKSQKTEVRGSESEGTNNQGYYFHYQNC